jgi:hypothetical protein
MYNEVFISYSVDADPDLVERVVEFFEERCMSAFEYKHDEGGYGEALTERIENQIRDCKYVVFLITDKFLASRWVKFEIEATKKHQKSPIVLKHIGIDAGRLPPELRERKFIEYSNVKQAMGKLSEMPWGLTVYIPGAGFGGSKIEFSQEIPKVLYPIGDKPMLFHILNSLDSTSFNNAIIINKRATCHEYVEYLTKLERFPVKVECRETSAENWPEALVDLKPKATFLLQLCDVILYLDDDCDKSGLRQTWTDLIEEHKTLLLKKQDYLGTLVISRDYKIAAGWVDVDEVSKEVKRVDENPLAEHVNLFNINTGTALLEPKLLDFVQPGDESLLGGAILKAMNHEKKFGYHFWKKWYHVLNINDYSNLHRQYLNHQRSTKRRTGDEPTGSLSQ